VLLPKKRIQPTYIKKEEQPTNVGGKGKKPKKVATKNEVFFAKSNEKKKQWCELERF